MGAVVIRGLIMVTSMAIFLTSVANVALGIAPFYTAPYAPCSSYRYQNNGVMIAAASDVICGNRAACGRSYRVSGTRATNQGVPQPCRGDTGVVAKIVDYCPAGCQETIDPSQEAYFFTYDY